MLPTVAPPVQAFFTVIVTVVKVDEIAQDSPCACVCREGRYSNVVEIVVHVTDAASAEDVRLKNTETWTKNTAL